MVFGGKDAACVHGMARGCVSFAARLSPLRAKLGASFLGRRVISKAQGKGTDHIYYAQLGTLSPPCTLIPAISKPDTKRACSFGQGGEVIMYKRKK